MPQGQDYSGFLVQPATFPAFDKVADTMQRNAELKLQTDYRDKKEKEADDWKKLNLIQEATDLSKHQTGSDVANAIGNQHAAELLQKYTALSGSMNPAELQSKISQDMSGLINGMDAMKNELEQSDAQLALLKQNMPDLNIAQLAKDSRADIVSRRLKDGQQFTNPLEVPPSAINYGDPEFLSNYVTGNKNLSNAIINPQGTEAESVLMGKQGDYTKFEAKLPFWKKPNYDRTKFNGEGFYTGKDIPTLSLKNSVLPSDALPASNGKPFTVIDKDVYDRFSQDGKMKIELIAATKQAFPDYKNFNPQEKEYAERYVLNKQLETLDQSQLHPTSNVRPQVVHNRTTVNTGGKTAAPIDLREQEDVGEGFKDVTSLFGGINSTSLPTGGSFRPAYVRYNPITKQIKYKDYVDKNKEGEYGGTPKEKTVSLVKFKQDLKTQNPQVDMKFLDGLDNPITGKAQEEKPTSKMVIMVLPNGVKGQIPEDQVSQFLKDNPKAKRQ